MDSMRYEKTEVNSIMTSNAPADAIFSVQNVSKRYGNNTILDGIDFSIKPGEIFGIIGVSGVGKTTLLNLLIGFVRPDDGDVLFRSDDLLLTSKGPKFVSVSKYQKKLKNLIGFAAQEPSFYDDLTVEENLLYFGSLYGMSTEEIMTNMETALDLVGLSHNRKVFANQLSGGMQKRLDIACALIHNPKILILDEPTADLDVILRRQMWDLVKKINAKGTTVVLSSHSLDEIETLCNNIIMLNNRRIVCKGSVEDLKNRYSCNEEVHLQLHPAEYKKIMEKLSKKKLGIVNMVEADGKLIVYAPSAEKILHETIHLIEDSKEKIIDIDLRRPTLSEVFEEFTKEA